MRVIVTGAKAGVGHQVVIACRTLSKAQPAAAGEAIAYEVSSQATGPGVGAVATGAAIRYGRDRLWDIRA
jgi:hypothetical protein